MLTLNYWSCIETCADLRAGVVTREDARVMKENVLCGQSQPKDQRVLINVKPIVINMFGS